MFKPMVWSLGLVAITPFGIALAFSCFWYLFSVFKKLNKEYGEEKVINFSLATIGSFFLGGRLTYGFFHLSDWGASFSSWFGFWHQSGFSFSGGLICLFLALVFFCRFQGWNVWYFLESVTGIVLSGGMVISPGLFLTGAEIVYLAHFFFLLIAFLQSRIFSGYRSFSWYPSGRTGFIFLTSLATTSFLEGGLDFYLARHIYWRGLIFWLIAATGVIFLRRLSRDGKVGK